MAVSFDRVYAGDVLYDVKRQKIGNTTMSHWVWWEVRIISIDHAKRKAVVSWNGNAPKEYCASDVARLYRSVPKAAREQRGLFR